MHVYFKKGAGKEHNTSIIMNELYLSVTSSSSEALIGHSAHSNLTQIKSNIFFFRRGENWSTREKPLDAGALFGCHTQLFLYLMNGGEGF